ncbi:Uncharacterised protein [Enterobacter cloacae]|nr:Uncharacterised protein [Enterobacter cloacae]
MCQLSFRIVNGHVADQQLWRMLFNSLVNSGHDQNAHRGRGAYGDGSLLIVTAGEIQRAQNRFQTLADVLMQMGGVRGGGYALAFTNK